MLDQLITLDTSVDPGTKEIAPVIVVALAFVMAIGSMALAAYIICGWHGAKNVMMDFLHGKATFVCR